MKKKSKKSCWRPLGCLLLIGSPCFIGLGIPGYEMTRRVTSDAPSGKVLDSLLTTDATGQNKLWLLMDESVYIYVETESGSSHSCEDPMDC